MKGFWKIFLIVICFLLMAAHLSRANMNVLAIVCLLSTGILFWKSKYSARAIQIALVIFFLEWVRSMVFYIQQRIENGEDWLRLAIILGVVAILNLLTLRVFRSRYMIERYKLE